MSKKTQGLLMMTPLILLLIGLFGYFIFFIVKVGGLFELLKFIGTFIVAFIVTQLAIVGLQKYIESKYE